MEKEVTMLEKKSQTEPNNPGGPGTWRQILLLYIKDYRSFKGPIWLWFILFIIMILFTTILAEAIDFALIFCSILWIESRMGLESKTNIDGHLCSLPLKRSNLVKYRYISSLTGLVAMVLIGGLTVTLIIRWVFPSLNKMELGTVINAGSWVFYISALAFYISISHYIYHCFRFSGPVLSLISVTAFAILIGMAIGLLYIFTSVISGSWDLPLHAISEKLSNRSDWIIKSVWGVIQKSNQVLGRAGLNLVFAGIAAVLFYFSLHRSINIYEKKDL